MDPQTCLYLFLEAVEEKDYDYAKTLAEDYANWISRGGARAIDYDGCGLPVIRLDPRNDRILVVESDERTRWESAV